MAEETLELHLLVLRCQVGDEGAFARLFEWFGPRTLGYLRSLLGDEAEDLQQEVWLAVYRNIRNLSNPHAFRTWLFQATRHRAIDFLRRRKRADTLLEGAAVELGEADSAVDPPEDAAPDPAALESALAALPAVQREVLRLRYQDDLSYAEIALVVGCAIGTVRSRLHHAKRHLQSIISTR